MPSWDSSVCNSAHGEAAMRIHFEQTGGIMGRKISLDLNSSDLSADELASLRQALDEVNFFSLPEELATRLVPDELHYLVTIETETITHSVRASDTSAPPTLSALIQNLSQLARTRR
jgi:hypothetical protein